MEKMYQIFLRHIFLMYILLMPSHNGMPIEKNGHTKMFFAITFEPSKLQERTIPL